MTSTLAILGYSCAAVSIPSLLKLAAMLSIGRPMASPPLSHPHPILSVRVPGPTFTGHLSITFQPEVGPLPPSGPAVPMFCASPRPLGPVAGGRR